MDELDQIINASNRSDTRQKQQQPPSGAQQGPKAPLQAAASLLDSLADLDIATPPTHTTQPPQPAGAVSGAPASPAQYKVNHSMEQAVRQVNMTKYAGEEAV